MISVGEDVEKRKPSCTVSRNVNWCRKNSMEVPQNITNRTTNDPAILLRSNYPKELTTGSWRAICTPLFTTALFTIVRRWKQPECSPTGEWINEMWCVHTTDYYLALKTLLRGYICYEFSSPFFFKGRKQTHLPILKLCDSLTGL